MQFGPENQLSQLSPALQGGHGRPVRCTAPQNSTSSNKPILLFGLVSRQRLTMLFQSSEMSFAMSLQEKATSEVLNLALCHLLQQHPHGSTEAENLCCLQGPGIQIPPAWENIPLGSTPGKVFPVWIAVLFIQQLRLC